MGFSVRERADFAGTFRWICVQAMETLARWIPTTPEMEAKVLFGRHVWEFAQHADALGKRAFELRAPLQFNLPACPAYREWLGEIAALDATAERVTAFYDLLCPTLARRYQRYNDATDALMDEPTVRILQRALVDIERMSDERRQLPAPLQHLSQPGRLDSWLTREAAIADVRPQSEPAPSATAA